MMSATYKILVIEDEPEMRRNLLTILKLEKFQAVGAENGRAGIDVARRERPDLIICDVMMPEVDGHGVLRALRDDANTAAVPFIFLTAKGDKVDVRTGMNLGADDYLTKPVAKVDLLAAIAARLKRGSEQATNDFEPDFSSPERLLSLGVSARVAEVLLWVAQGKTNAEIATILGISESTVKKHVMEIFNVLGVETRNAATLRALECLNSRRSA
jgi:DNA-binding NarL/FixJ family response regulator